MNNINMHLALESKTQILQCFLFTIIDIKLEMIRHNTESLSIVDYNKGDELQEISNNLEKLIKEAVQNKITIGIDEID